MSRTQEVEGIEAETKALQKQLEALQIKSKSLKETPEYKDELITQLKAKVTELEKERDELKENYEILRQYILNDLRSSLVSRRMHRARYLAERSYLLFTDDF